MVAVFWALRGGGSGSWGVITSATFKVFPTFEAVLHHVTIVVNSTEDISTLTTLHAQHIFDTDVLHPGQYFYWTATPPKFTWNIDTVFPNTSIAAANATLSPFLEAVSKAGFSFQPLITSASVNQILSGGSTGTGDDLGGSEEVLGSRLWADDVYTQKVTAIGAAYKALFDGGASGFVSDRVSGRVSAAHDSLFSACWET